MPEMTDEQYLRDLADRIWHIPARFNVDESDVDLLRDIANRMENRINDRVDEKRFTLHWLDGKKETVTGTSIPDAFARAGYGSGALAAVDYFEEVK